MEALDVAKRLAAGGKFQELTVGERALNANRVFRVWPGGDSIILKVYGTAARARRERHALETLAGLEGVPSIADQGLDGDVSWAVFPDGGGWTLGSLPENPRLARKAGAILRAVHDSPPATMSNLARGIDQEWVAVDFVFTFRRLDRYRGRIGLSPSLYDAAKGVRPPFATEPRASHTDPTPDNFLVNDDGDVTLINWEWATLAPPEWDLSKAAWLTGIASGPDAAAALQEGYGSVLEPTMLDRWTVYHAVMMLVYEAENRVRGGGEGEFEHLVAELQRAVAGSQPSRTG